MNAMLLVAAVAVATAPVRDPFWPVGYEGTRYVISAEPRESLAVEEKIEEKREPEPEEVQEAVDPGEEWARRAEEARLKLAMDKRWSEAVGKLRFGGTVKAQDGASSVLINGTARAEGDYVRLDHDGYRFIWRVARSATERKLKLDRVKAVGLNEIKGKKQDK